MFPLGILIEIHPNGSFSDFKLSIHHVLSPKAWCSTFTYTTKYSLRPGEGRGGGDLICTEHAVCINKNAKRETCPATTCKPHVHVSHVHVPCIAFPVYPAFSDMRALPPAHIPCVLMHIYTGIKLQVCLRDPSYILFQVFCLIAGQMKHTKQEAKGTGGPAMCDY